MVTMSIVVPCYNEEAVLPETARRLLELIGRLRHAGKVGARSSVYFIDDGSKDRTWPLIEKLSRQHPAIGGVKLSRNRGHQNALIAGLFRAPGDVVVSVDADLQDDLNAIEEMIDAHLAGCDIVYGVRRSRCVDTMFKRFTAEAYYRVLKAMGVDVIFNHADYRLMSRRAIEALKEFKEVNLFLRGIIPQLGFATAIVRYDRAGRFAGASKYPLMKMLALAVQGITSFSATPLRMITATGLIVSLGTFIVTLWALFVRLFTDDAVPGWTSTVVPMYFLGGIQLLSLGVIGEYLAKVYMETKKRPRYIIEKVVGGRASSLAAPAVPTSQSLAQDPQMILE
ncbi:MAG: glycosyltransferase [Betaproteobacteria bacterium RIFCSPLOWO2_12_FULL_62_13b]|nr:MAG: glycosyltransferase [Betaproteobacteria bacterium RIFCSPLOWO2_12_FULL_62_13b]